MGLARGEGKERILHILDRAGNQVDEIQMTIAKGDHSLYYAADADEIFLKTAKDDAFPGYVLHKADIGTEKFVPVELKQP